MQQYQSMPFGFPLSPFTGCGVFFPPYVDDCDLFINSTIIGPPGPQGPAGPQGPVGPQGPAGTPGLVPVTIVTTTPFNATTAMYYIGVDVDTAASIILPASPTGTVFIIKDIDGDAATNPITITATGGQLIDGSSSAIINTDYGSLELIFNGTEWSIA